MIIPLSIYVSEWFPLILPYQSVFTTFSVFTSSTFKMPYHKEGNYVCNCIYLK